MTRRQQAIAFFVALCVLLVIAALLLNISWVITNAGRIAPIIFGVVLFGLIIAGLIVYTVFLVLEIKRNEEHDSFINAVTHELKTPIASIRLYLETLQSRDVSETRRREFYEIMLADAERLHRTVDQVLKAGVVRERQKAFVRGPVDVGALTDECVELAIVRHHLHADAIELDAPRDRALVVSGDAEELRTVVTNLLDNAVKYSGSNVRVTVSVAAPAPDTVWVRVQDRGIGIPKKQLKTDLQPLLSRAGAWLAEHQGHGPRPVHRQSDCARPRRARIRAERGRGSRRDVHAGVAATDHAMTRILIVEDEQHIADGLRFNLEAEGYDAVIARDGEQALELLLKERRAFEVVVLDVMLPGKDGFTVAAELRAAGQFVPILMLTARGRPEDVLRGFESGADDYLPKPFELAILLARLKGLQRRRRWNERDVEAADTTPETYSFEGRTLDFGAMEVRAHGNSYRLTQMECDLLKYLVRNAGQAISRGKLLEEVWGLHERTDTRAIDNFIVRLRRYLEDRPAAPRILLTVRGVGYKFVAPEAVKSSP